MKIVEPLEKSNLVRAGSLRQESEFKDNKGDSFVILDMQSCYFDYCVKESTEIDYDPIWVFNVKMNTLGIFDADKMVEPVELEVHVKGIE